MRFKSQADADAYAAKNPQAAPTKVPKLAAKAGFKGPKSLAAHVKSNPNSLAARRGMGSAKSAQEAGKADIVNLRKPNPAPVTPRPRTPPQPTPDVPANAGPQPPKGGSGGIYANPNQGNPWGPGAEGGAMQPPSPTPNLHPNNPYAINGGGGRYGQHLPPGGPAGADPNGSVDSGSMGTMGGGGLADAVGMGPRQGAMPMPGPGPMPGPPTGAGGTMRNLPMPMTPRPFGPQGGMDQGSQGTGFVPDIPNPQGAARQQMAGNLRRRNVPMLPPMTNPGGWSSGPL